MAQSWCFWDQVFRLQSAEPRAIVWKVFGTPTIPVSPTWPYFSWMQLPKGGAQSTAFIQDPTSRVWKLLWSQWVLSLMFLFVLVHIMKSISKFQHLFCMRLVHVATWSNQWVGLCSHETLSLVNITHILERSPRCCPRLEDDERHDP